MTPIDRTLESAWQALSPPAGLEARVRANLLAGGGAGPTGSTSGASGASGVASMPRGTSRWGALRASGSLGAGVGAALLALGFLAGYWSRPSAPPAAPVSSPAPAVKDAARDEAPNASSVEAPAPLTGASEGHAAAPPPDAIASRAAHPAVPPRKTPPRATERPDPLQEGEELRLLARAERAVRTNNAALARALTRELAERFPRSPLHEERRAIELMALCQQVDPERAARRAEFERDYPKSVYAERVTGVCAADDANRAAPSVQRIDDVGSTKRNGEDMNRLEGGQHGPSSSP